MHVVMQGGGSLSNARRNAGVVCFISRVHFYFKIFFYIFLIFFNYCTTNHLHLSYMYITNVLLPPVMHFCGTEGCYTVLAVVVLGKEFN